MTRAPKPIESFGPELLRTLTEGAKRKVEIELPYNEASRLRQRLNQLRYEMRRQDHTLFPVVSQATITITWPPDTAVNTSVRNVPSPKDKTTLCKVIVSPSDSEFAEALSKAGVTVPELPSETLPATDTPLTTTVAGRDILEDYVKEVK